MVMVMVMVVMRRRRRQHPPPIAPHIAVSPIPATAVMMVMVVMVVRNILSRHQLGWRCGSICGVGHPKRLKRVRHGREQIGIRDLCRDRRQLLSGGGNSRGNAYCGGSHDHSSFAVHRIFL
jgi:hypothetical protein